MSFRAIGMNSYNLKINRIPKKKELQLDYGYNKSQEIPAINLRSSKMPEVWVKTQS